MSNKKVSLVDELFSRSKSATVQKFQPTELKHTNEGVYRITSHEKKEVLGKEFVEFVFIYEGLDGRDEVITKFGRIAILESKIEKEDLLSLKDNIDFIDLSGYSLTLNSKGGIFVTKREMAEENIQINIRSNNKDILNNISFRHSNPYLKYLHDPTIKDSGLYAEIKYEEEIIGRGIILDFYSDFSKGYYDGRTSVGGRINGIKYRGFGCLELTRNWSINYFCKELEEKISHSSLLEEITNNKNKPMITYVPSTKKIPNYTSVALYDKLKVSSKNLSICHNLIQTNASLVQGKGAGGVGEALKIARQKYIFDIDYLKKDENRSNQYIIVDDVFGYGATLITTLKAFYDITNKCNYFLCLAKDVKR